MRSFFAAALIGAAGLSLVPHVGHTQDRTFYFSGCSNGGACGTATMLLAAVQGGVPGQTFVTITTDITWHNPGGGGIIGELGALYVTPITGLWESPNVFACNYIAPRTRAECSVTWWRERGDVVLPPDFRPTSIDIRVGYGIDPVTEHPLSEGTLTLYVTPEPATFALLGGGLLALGGAAIVRRRRTGA